MATIFITTHAPREGGTPIHFYKYEIKDRSFVFYMLEIWNKSAPDKIVYKEYNKYDLADFIKSMSKAKQTIEKNIQKENAKDLIFSFQVDIDGGGQTFYGYKNGEKKAPPHARSPIYKKPLDPTVEILTLAKKTGISFYYQKDLTSPELIEQLESLKNIATRLAFNNGDNEFVNTFRQSNETNFELAFEDKNE